MLVVAIACWLGTLAVAVPRVISGKSGKTGAAVIVALLVFSVASTWRVVERARLVDALEKAVEPVAGRDVNIHCKNEYLGQFAASQHTGYVPYKQSDPLGTSQDIFLRSSVCDTLAEAIAGWDTTVEFAAAVQVLTHEAMHVSGEKNEAVAECAAMQKMGSVAARLGADPGVAKNLTLTYHRSLYERMPSEYQSGDCVEGGALDLKLGDGPWD